MEIRYAVRIEDVFDIRKNKGFLEEMYEDLFQLYQRKYFLLNVYHENDKKIRVLDFKIKGKLREYNLPAVIVFEGEEGMSRVREFISKGELFLPFPVLEKYRITRYAEKNSSYYFNIYHFYLLFLKDEKHCLMDFSNGILHKPPNLYFLVNLTNTLLLNIFLSLYLKTYLLFLFFFLKLKIRKESEKFSKECPLFPILRDKRNVPLSLKIINKEFTFKIWYVIIFLVIMSKNRGVINESNTFNKHGNKY